jgi:hypothetical protein
MGTWQAAGDQREPTQHRSRVQLEGAVAVGLLAAAFWAVLIHHKAVSDFGGDIRGLLLLGANRPHPAAMDGIPREEKAGYDGQYYAALATDPWLRRAETVASLDEPAYRARRFGLPLAAWLVALGHPARAIFLYQLLCWLGAAAGVILLAHWLGGGGASRGWALVAGLGAGTLASVLRCTPDAAAVALLVAALLAHRRERFSAAVLLASAATAVRETSWLAALAVAVGEATRGRWRRALLAASVPLLLPLLWTAWLSRTLNSLAGAGRANFALPFAWVTAKAGQLGEAATPNPVEVVGVGAIVVVLLSPLVVCRRRLLGDSTTLTYLFFGALAWSLGWAVWSDAYAFSRVLLPLPFLAPVVAQAEGDRGRRALLLAVPLSLLAVGGAMVWQCGWGGARRAGGDREKVGVVLPAPAEPVFVLGAARTRGQRGVWQTDVELANPLLAGVRVRLEVLPTDPAKRPVGGAVVQLRPRQVRVVEKVLESVVPFYGAVALRVTPDRPGVAVRWRTYLEGVGQERPPWNVALPSSAAFRQGEVAVFSGLAHDPATAKRSDLALLNVSEQSLHLQLSIRSGERSTVREEVLEPWQFRLLPGVLETLAPPPVTAGVVTVTAGTPGGAFLVRAVVLEGGIPRLQVEAVRRQPGV